MLITAMFIMWLLPAKNEINENKITLKNMLTGEQRLVDADELVSIVKS